MTSGSVQRRGAMAAALAILLTASLAIGFLAVEIAYRGFLYVTRPDSFAGLPVAA